MKKTYLLVIPLALLAVAFFLGGCSYQSATPSGGSTPKNPSSSSTPATTPSPTTNQTAGAVTIQNFAFSPASLTIKKGESVTWTNQDSAPHQIVSDSGTFQGNTISQGQTYFFTFDTAGQFPYHCSIHPSMKGTIVVE